MYARRMGQYPRLMEYGRRCEQIAQSEKDWEVPKGRDDA